MQAVEDDPFLSCSFCGTRVFLDASRAVRHLIVEPRLDRAMAASSLARWLKSQEVVGQVVPSSSELVFFPLWQITTRGTARVIPAAGALYEGLERIPIPAGDQKVFAQDRVKGARGEPARLIEATVPLQAALARSAARASGLGESKIAAGPSDQGAAPPEDAEARLIHVPLHLLVYPYHGVEYRAAVDASEGKVYPVSAPRSAESRIDLAFAGLLGAGLVLNLAALSFFRGAPLVSLALLGAVTWGIYAVGMRLARWMES